MNLTLLKKYETLEISKVSEKDQKTLEQVKKLLNNFEETNEAKNKVGEQILDQVIKLNPDAVKKPQVVAQQVAKVQKVAKAKKVTQAKKPATTSTAKTSGNNIMSVAKEIQKTGESWKDAMERAKTVLKERRGQVAEQKKTELEKLLALVRTKKELIGFSKSDIERDAVREAKPTGARVVTKAGFTSNQHGVDYPNKLGRKYWETRDRHADRLAPNYPKDMPLLASGGGFGSKKYKKGDKITTEFGTYYVDGINQELQDYIDKNKSMGLDSVLTEKKVNIVYSKYFNEDNAVTATLRSWFDDKKQPTEKGVRDAMIWSYDSYMDYQIKAGGGSKSDSEFSSMIRIAIADANGNDKDVAILKKYSTDFKDVLITIKEIQALEEVLETKGAKDRKSKDKLIATINLMFQYEFSGVGRDINGKPLSKEVLNRIFNNAVNDYSKAEINSAIDRKQNAIMSMAKNSYVGDTKEKVEERVSDANKEVRVLENVRSKFHSEKFADGGGIDGGMNNLTMQNVSFAKGGNLKSEFVDLNEPPVGYDLFTYFYSTDEKSGKIVWNIVGAYNDVENGEEVRKWLDNQSKKSGFVTLKDGTKIKISGRGSASESGLASDVKLNKGIIRVWEEFKPKYWNDETSDDENWDDYANGGMTDLTMQNVSFAKGGNVSNEEKLLKELSKVQRDLNSSRLSTYREGDDSQEEKDRIRERESKLARFNEILKVLRESDAKFANGGSLPFMTDPNFGDFQNTGSFANGGLLVNNSTDLEEVAKYMFTSVKKRSWDLRDLIHYFNEDNGFDYRNSVKVWDDMNGYEMRKTYDNILEMLKRIVEANNKKFELGGAFMTDPNFGNFQNTGAFEDGGETDGYTLNNTVEFTTSDDDSYLRGNIGGDMMDLIEVEKIDDNKYSAIAKSYSVAFEGLKGQELEDEVYNQINEMFTTNDDIEVDLESVKIVGKFELGGAFMMTDLAGHTGGSDGLGNPMPLSGVSGTYYTGLVGETGALSSGELFENGGGINMSFGWAKKYLEDNNLYKKLGWYLMMGNGKEKTIKNQDYVIFEDGSALKYDKNQSDWIGYNFPLKKENGGAMAQNQQVINDASQSYVNYYLGEGASQGIYKDGGSIDNQYEGRTPEDVWNNWDLSQKLHFLSDHTEEVYGKASVKGQTNNEINEFFGKLIYEKYDDLPLNTKVALVMHTTRGQYAKGGALKDIDDNLYVSISKTEDDYWFITSKPTTKKQAEEMANLVTPMRGEVNDVKTVGQVKAHSKVIYENGGAFAPNVSNGTQFMSGVYADGGSMSEDISECKKLVSAFCKEFGDKFGLNEEAILEKVKFRDYLGNGASVFVSLSVTSNVEDLKVGETRPTGGYIIFTSDINPNGVTGKDDIARTYSIDIEIKGVKRYTQRRTEEGRYFKSYNYGRTIEEAMDKTDTKIIYDLYSLEKKDDLKFKMSSLFADGGAFAPSVSNGTQFMNGVYANGGSVNDSVIDELWNGYASAVLFTETDSDSGEPLDSEYSVSDFDKETVTSTKKMLADYYSENKDAIEESGLDLDTIGNDIWYTRSGQGAGFFDHSLDEEVEEKLTKGAEALGEYPSVETYDGKISVRGGKVFAKGGFVGTVEFNVGDTVWQKDEKRYATVMNNYGDPINGDYGDIRLDTTGNTGIYSFDPKRKTPATIETQTGYNLIKVGEKGDTGKFTPEVLEDMKASANRLIESRRQGKDKEGVAYYQEVYKRLLDGEFDSMTGAKATASNKKSSVDYTYVPNKDVKELSVVVKGELKKLMGSDILDGVYVKNSAKSTAKSTAKVDANAVFAKMLKDAKEAKRGKSKRFDASDLKKLNLEMVQKLVEAGYTEQQIRNVIFGYTFDNQVLAEGEFDTQSGIFGYEDTYVKSKIEGLVEAQKNKEFAVGIEYPDFDWQGIIKKYKISSKPKDITEKQKGTSGSTENYYEVFVGENIVIGHNYGYKWLDADGKVLSNYMEEDKKVSDPTKQNAWQKERGQKAGFNGGYWYVVSSKIEIIDDVLKNLLAQKGGYCKELEFYDDSLPKALKENKIEFELGGDFAPNVSDGTQFMSGVYANGGVLNKDNVKVGDVLMSTTGVKVKVTEFDPLFGGRVKAIRLDKYGTGKPSQFMSLSKFTNKVEVKKTKKELREEFLEDLSSQVAEVWDKIGADSGGSIRTDDKLLKGYAEGTEEVMQKNDVKKGSFNQSDYDYYLDGNDHLLNDFLVFNGYYNSQVTKAETDWRMKQFDEAMKQYGKSQYVANPNIVKVSAKSSSSSKPKKYIDHDDIESVTLNVNTNFITFAGKDFLNGANLMEKGGDLSKIATYFPIRDIVKVTLKNGETIKPLNGYWLKKGSEPMGKIKTTTPPKNTTSKAGKVTSPNYPDVNFNHKVVINGKTINLALAKSYVTGLNGSRQYDFIDVDGNPMTGYGFSVKEALKQVEDYGNNPIYYTKNTPPKIDETKAHFKMDVSGGKFEVFVDSNFVNQSQGNLPNTELKHYGYGDFYLQTPDGNIDFIRTSEEKEGFVGRTHKMKGSDELVLKLVNAMKEKGRFESTQTFADGGFMNNVYADGGNIEKGSTITLKNDVYASYTNKLIPKGTKLRLIATPPKVFGKNTYFVYAKTLDNKEEIHTDKSNFVEKIKELESFFAKGGEMQGNNIDAELENFDIDNLDPFETMQFNHHIKSSGKVGALQVLINSVEGDYSQLSPELAELAEMQMSSEEYDEAGKQMRFERDGYANGGMTGLEYKNSPQYKELKDKRNRLYAQLKSRVVRAVGLDSAMEFYDADLKIAPYRFLERAVTGNFISLDEVNQRLIDSAMEEAEEIDNDDDLEEIGSSDFTYYLKSVLDGAGFKVGFVGSTLKRLNEDGSIKQINNGFFEDGGFMNGVYAKGGELQGKFLAEIGVPYNFEYVVEDEYEFSRFLSKALTNKFNFGNGAWGIKIVKPLFEKNYGQKIVVEIEIPVGVTQSEGLSKFDVLEFMSKTLTKKWFGNGVWNVDVVNSYANGGSMNSSGEITINKRNFDVIVMPKKLEIEVQITRADTVDQYGLNDAEVEWHQERWGYVIKADDNKKFNKALRVLGITQKFADGGFMADVYANGGGVGKENIRIVNTSRVTGGMNPTIRFNFSDGTVLKTKSDGYGVEYEKEVYQDLISKWFDSDDDYELGGIEDAKYADGAMLDDNEGFMKADNENNYRYPEMEVYVETIDEPIDLTNKVSRISGKVDTLDEPIDLRSNVSRRTNDVVIRTLDESADLNDDKRVRARMSYNPKDRNPDKLLSVNPRAFEFIKDLPTPTSNTHKND